MHVLIVKHGALGDVVRTSYFAAALRNQYGCGLRLSWLTAPSAIPLLRFNPHIDDLWTNFERASTCCFDKIFSLDDEVDIVSGVMRLHADQVIGAIVDPATGGLTYTQEAAEWFDMGLLSKYGRKCADQLKKANVRSHAEIFSAIFGVEGVVPEFWGDSRIEDQARQDFAAEGAVIGINPYAGGRWKSKELPDSELRCLIASLLRNGSLGSDGKIILFGAGSDFQRNLRVSEEVRDPRVCVPNTDDSILHLAAIVRTLDYLISSDSLALHLGISQHVPFLAFFAPTSATEIDDFGLGTKLTSGAEDYCSYRPDADNSTITAVRIIELASRHKPVLFSSSCHTLDTPSGTLGLDIGR